MPRTRRLCALLALAAFLGGGLVAPAVHRAAHGIEHAHARHEAATQTDHVHTDGTGFTVSLDGLPLGHEPCLLCLPKQRATTPPPASPPLFTADRSLVPQRAIAPATAVLALLPIRGPPSVA